MLGLNTKIYADAVATWLETWALSADMLNHRFESHSGLGPWYFYVVLSCVGRDLVTS
jgi:hypothetical protein